MDPKKIKANEDNDKKFLTGDLEEEEKKKKKNEPYTESGDGDTPLEYFTE